MKILILDDEQSRHDNFAARYAGRDWELTHVKTIAEFEDALAKGPYDVVQLDHDLADYVRGMYGIEYERTGVEAVKLLLACSWRPVAVFIHSWNPDGAKRMQELLRDARIDPIMAPFEYR